MNRRMMSVGEHWSRRLIRALIVPGLDLAALLASFGVSDGAERVGVRGGLHATFAHNK